MTDPDGVDAMTRTITALGALLRERDAEIDSLRRTIRAALNELGVPNADYAASIATAVAILRQQKVQT